MSLSSSMWASGGCSSVFVSRAPGQKTGNGDGVYSTEMVLEDLNVGGNRQGTPDTGEWG